jgi:hypothetical protein
VSLRTDEIVQNGAGCGPVGTRYDFGRGGGGGLVGA